MSVEPREVVTFGESMGLLLADGDVPLAQACHFRLSIAGAESNVAIGLARLGHRVAFAGLVGDDVFGYRIRQELRGEGIDVSSLHVDSDRPTGLLFRDSPHGRPITVVYRRSASAASGLTVDQLPMSMIANAKLLHTTGITAALSDSAFDATVQAMAWAREQGVTVSFDPNVRLRLADPARWAEIVDTLARHADIVLTGHDEMRPICRDVAVERWFAERGARILIIKDGARGATEFDLEQVITTPQPATEVPLVDPVGAGDAFNAGWLSAWLRALPPAQRMREAVTVAGLAVATRGDCAGLPDAVTRDLVVAQGQDIDR